MGKRDRDTRETKTEIDRDTDGQTETHIQTRTS